MHACLSGDDLVHAVYLAPPEPLLHDVHVAVLRQGLTLLPAEDRPQRGYAGSLPAGLAYVGPARIYEGQYEGVQAAVVRDPGGQHVAVWRVDTYPPAGSACPGALRLWCGGDILPLYRAVAREIRSARHLATSSVWPDVVPGPRERDGELWW